MFVIVFWIAIGIATLVLALRVLQQVLLRRACRAGAEKIHANLVAVFKGPHQYRKLGRDQFSNLDWTQYDGVHGVLTDRGFRSLGGIEDVTTSGASPEFRTLIERYCSVDGMISVGTYWMKEIQAVDVSSELLDGRLLLTTNTELDKLGPPPNVRRQAFPASTGVGALLDSHLERLTALRLAEPDAQLLSLNSMTAALEAATRFSTTMSEHRQSIGLLTREELLAIAGESDQEATTELVWVEFRRIQEEQSAA